MQNEQPEEYRRRLRIVRPVMWLTLLLDIASVGAYFGGLLPASVSGAMLTVIGLCSAWQNHFGGGNVWKGRRYDRATLLGNTGSDGMSPPRQIGGSL